MNKKYFVTGSGGFISSNLVEYLLNKNEFFRVFIIYIFQNLSGWLDTIKNHPNLEVYYGDVRDYNSIKNAISGCDVIFHLAAFICIPYSYITLRSYIDTNIQGALNILQSCQELNVSKLIITSTSEIYGTAQYIPNGNWFDIGRPADYEAANKNINDLIEEL